MGSSTSCSRPWEETLDAGPYALGESGKLDLGKVLQGDRFFALLMVRALTYGPEYAFGMSCRNDDCRARIEWEIHLTKLPVRDGPRAFPNIELLLRARTSADVT